MTDRATQHSLILNQGDVRYRARVTKYSPTYPSGSPPWWTSAPTLGSGTILRLGKQQADSWSIERSRDQLSAACSIVFANDPLGTYSDRVDKMDLLRFQVKVWGGSYTGQLFDIGWFFVDNKRVSGNMVSLQCRDAVKLGLIDLYTGTLAGDRFREPLQDPGTTEYVVLDRVDRAHYYLFVDSDEATDEKRQLNHTVNWASNPMAEFLRSADTNATKSAGDELLDVNTEAIKVLWGLGELRIDKQVYDNDYSALPNIKARYWRFANYTDAVRGVVTAVSTTTVTDSNRGLVTDRYIGARLRFTSGAQRFRSFEVTDNDGTTITLDTDVAALNVAEGDRYELVDLNDARWRMADLALASGFQSLMESRPFFVSDVEHLVLDKDPAMVLKDVVSPAATTDITADMTDEELQFPTSPTTATVLQADGDYLSVADNAKFGNIYVRVNNSPTNDFPVRWEFWNNGGAWESLETHNLVDRTNGLKQSGLVSFNIPETWALKETGVSDVASSIATATQTLSAGGSATGISHGLGSVPVGIFLTVPPSTVHYWVSYDNSPEASLYADDNGDGTFDIQADFGGSTTLRWWAFKAVAGYIVTGTTTLDGSGDKTGISHGLGSVPVGIVLSYPGTTNRYYNHSDLGTGRSLYGRDNGDGTLDIYSNFGAGQTIRWWAFKAVPGSIATGLSSWVSGVQTNISNTLNPGSVGLIVSYGDGTDNKYTVPHRTTSYQYSVDNQNGTFNTYTNIWGSNSFRWWAFRLSSGNLPWKFVVRAISGVGTRGAKSTTDFLVQSGTGTTSNSGTEVGKLSVAFPTAYDGSEDLPSVIVGIEDSATSQDRACTVRIEGISRTGFRVATYDGSDLATKDIQWIACGEKTSPSNQHVQSGTVTTDANGTATVTFGTAFTSVPNVVPTVEGQTADPYGNNWVKVRSVSTTQAIFDTYSEGTSASLKIHWIAEGPVAAGSMPNVRWGTAYAAKEGSNKGLATGVFDNYFDSAPDVVSTPFESAEKVDESPLTQALGTLDAKYFTIQAETNTVLTDTDFSYLAVNSSGSLNAPGNAVTPPQLSTVRLRDPVTAKQPRTYRTADDKKPFDIIEQEYRPDLPANYLFRVKENGRLELGNMVQDEVQRYTLNTYTGVLKEETDADFFTKVVYRGQAHELLDYARLQYGASVTDDGSAYVTSDSSNKYTNGIDIIIDGSDVQELTLSSGRFLEGYRWEGTGGTPIPADTDLMTLDLGNMADDVEQVSITFYADNLSTLPEMDILVSEDDITYVKLCDRTKPFHFSDLGQIITAGGWMPTWQYGYHYTTEYVPPVVNMNGYYSVDLLYANEANWTRKFRYLKFVHMSPANTTFKYPYFMEISVYSPGVIEGVAELGVTAPFDTATYTALAARLRPRTLVVPGVDFSAGTVAVLDKRALLYLREVTRNLSTYSINGVRPDAGLYDTVAVTEKATGLSDDDVLIETIAMKPLGVIDVTARTYR